MLAVLEFIVFLFRVTTLALICAFFFWVVSSMVLLIKDDFFYKGEYEAEPYQGRHWRDKQDYNKKLYVVSFINRRREERGGIRSHRRLRHG